MIYFKRVTSFLLFLSFFSCKTTPEGIVAVKNFNIDRYLGKWYEVARFDFRFERDLNNTTATYTMMDNGSVKVVNRGFNYKSKEWKEAVGKAKFVEDPSVARLKVSFFGPFYGGYNVIALDEEYKYALIAGGSRDYLWILSRETSIPETVKADYLSIAESYGFDTSNLIWVEHDEE